MSLPVLVAVGLLGGAGALGRLLLDGAVSARADAFPFGTLLVNVSGAFALGFLVGLGAGGDTNRLLGTGLIGGFTTFSTWMFESHRLAEDRRGGLSVVNLAGSLVIGVAVAWVGSRFGAAL
jgi:CrcB protein